LALKCVLAFQYARASNGVDQTGSGRNTFVAEALIAWANKRSSICASFPRITAQFQRRRDYCSAGGRLACPTADLRERRIRVYSVEKLLFGSKVIFRFYRNAA
jgi:hypothetical protein